MTHEERAREWMSRHDAVYPALGATSLAAEFAAVEAPLQKRVAVLEAALKGVMPRMERGAWCHGFGCPAEDASGNGDCTCGVWMNVRAAQAALSGEPTALLKMLEKAALNAIGVHWIDKKTAEEDARAIAQETWEGR